MKVEQTPPTPPPVREFTITLTEPELIALLELATAGWMRSEFTGESRFLHGPVLAHLNSAASRWDVDFFGSFVADRKADFSQTLLKGRLL